MLRWGSACISAAMVLTLAAAPAFAEGWDGLSGDVPRENALKNDPYQYEFKINQMLRGYAGAAAALSGISIKGAGYLDYWKRDAELKQAGLEKLSSMIEAGMDFIRDSSLKVGLKSIVNLINNIQPTRQEDQAAYCDRATRFGNLSHQFHTTLEDLLVISDQKLDGLNLGKQARALFENNPEAFSSIVTDDMKATLANLQSGIDSHLTQAEQAKANAEKAATELKDLDANIKARKGQLAELEKKAGQLETNVTAARAQLGNIVANAARGQDSVEVKGLEFVTEGERADLKERLELQADHVLSEFRALLKIRANENYPFNPNFKWSYTLRKSTTKYYGRFSFRKGVKKVVAAGTINLEIFDGAHRSHLDHDFVLRYVPQRGLDLDLRFFVMREAGPELKTLKRLSTGTMNFERVIAGLESKLGEQCDELLSQIKSGKIQPVDDVP